MTTRLAGPSAADIHAMIGGRWPEVLASLGIDAESLKNRHGPCPGCGGDDRFRFDDKDGRGTWICSSQSAKPLAGDGFALLQHVHGWSFQEAWKAVLESIGEDRREDPKPKPRPRPQLVIASPTPRVKALAKTATDCASVDDVVRYLSARKLWPLPKGCALRGHAGADYWHERERVGRYPAMVAPVRDVHGTLVTAHVTYLRDGAKIEEFPARKILSPMTGRTGCAVHLVPTAGEVLGIAEGIETALAAHAIHVIPVWAALNTSMLSKFVPPAGVRKLVIFADRDVAGLEAAWALRDRTGIECELRVPRKGDWADEWEGQ